MTANVPLQTDVLVVGAGPAGSAAAAWAARQGLEVLLTDAAVFPRDKTCGDGLTPRAVAELQKLGLEDWLRAHTVNQGLRAHGFGQTLLLPWPGGTLPGLGLGRGPDRARRPHPHRPRSRRARPPSTASARSTYAARATGSPPSCSSGRASGSRSPAGAWSWPTASARRWASCSAGSGIATRCTASPAARTSPPGCRTTRGSARTSSSAARVARSCPATAGSSRWATGEVNIGVGTLATAKRPANVAIKPLMKFYAEQRRDEFELERRPADADVGAAADGRRGLQRGRPELGPDRRRRRLREPAQRRGHRLRARDRSDGRRHAGRRSDLATAWPALLREHYGESFSIARRLAGLVTVPAPAARPRPGRHALGLADDPGPALDGQPRHRRGPRPRGPGLALGGPPLARAGPPPPFT